MKNNFLIITVCLLLINIFMLSCSDDTQNNTTSTEDLNNNTVFENATVTTVASEAIPTIPDINLDGYVLNIGKPIQENIAWSTITFAVEAEDGEIINDAIFQRNLNVGEKYNFSLTEFEFNNVANEITNQILADDNTYDIFLNPMNSVGNLAQQNFLVNFYDIPNLYLDGYWWDQDMIRDLDIMNHLFFMNGDIIISVYDTLRTVMYNKNYAVDLGLDGFYEMVYNGDWVVDTMFEMMRLATRDENGDGIMDYRDVFGLMYNDSSYWANLLAHNAKAVTKNNNGVPTLAIDNEHFIISYDKTLKLFNSGYTFHYNNDKYPDLTARQAIVTLFDNKQALFFENGMSAAAQYMRNLTEVDFGFLPIPKLNAEQENYFSYVSSAPILCVPITNADLDKTGLVLEALCRDSSETVIPKYFETCFSLKYTHDEESYQMLLIATASRTYDIGMIYDWGGITSKINNAIKTNNENIVSLIESIRDTMLIEMNETIDKFNLIK